MSEFQQTTMIAAKAYKYKKRIRELESLVVQLLSTEEIMTDDIIKRADTFFQTMMPLGGWPQDYQIINELIDALKAAQNKLESYESTKADL
jgi:hypothetical protein